MDALLRESQTASSQSGLYTDIEISAPTITLGSAPDRTIQLLGRDITPEHATIDAVKNAVRITCSRNATVRIHGEAVKSSLLTIGDEVTVGGHRLILFEPPAGFDVAIQISRDPDLGGGDFESAFRTNLEQVRFSPRIVSWLAAVSIVLFGFVIPLLGNSSSTANPTALAWLPDDSLWSTGPLHEAHSASIGKSCEQCHSRVFQRVQDSACLACHTTIADHVSAETLSKPGSGLQPLRCATCHREHGEPDSYIVIRADELCVDCHQAPSELLANPEISMVSGFSENAHPHFSATIEKPVGRRAGTGLSFDWRLFSEPVESATDGSNLRFPHDTHLNPDAVTDPRDGSSVGCGHCHQLSLDREHFLPITMETHCVSCHELTFDPLKPDRQLPHGRPLEVIEVLRGQYLLNFSDPSIPQQAVARRRVPDRDDESRECVGTAFDCAARAAEDEIREQFSVRGCVSCHTVEEHGGTEIDARYQVHPVRLTTDYFPSGRFDHFSHQSINGRTGDDACLHCHAADRSSNSTDLLLPDLPVCLECHSDSPMPDRVPTNCVDCHSYHPYEHQYTGTIDLVDL